MVFILLENLAQNVSFATQDYLNVKTQISNITLQN